MKIEVPISIGRRLKILRAQWHSFVDRQFMQVAKTYEELVKEARQAEAEDPKEPIASWMKRREMVEKKLGKG